MLGTGLGAGTTLVTETISVSPYGAYILPGEIPE